MPVIRNERLKFKPEDGTWDFTEPSLREQLTHLKGNLNIQHPRKPK